MNNAIIKKQGKLSVALYQNKIKKNADENVTFYARTINRGICNNEDLASDLILLGKNNGFTKEQIVKIAELLNESKLSKISDGFIVDDGLFRSSAKVKGCFDSESEPFNKEKHSIEISVFPVAAAKNTLASLEPVITQGNSVKPNITEIFDLTSKGSEILTKGGFFDVYGSNIRIGGEAPDVGLYFVNVEDDTKTVCLKQESIGTNSQNHLACVVPVDLQTGSYKIKVVTQAVNSKVVRKQPLEFTFNTVLTVA